MNHLKGKRVLVTGACGTIGKELVIQLLKKYSPKEVIGIDNNESELFFLDQQVAQYQNARFVLADIREPNKIIRLMEDIQVVFHTAAYKHVIMCENSPFEAVQTNIIGVQNIINAALINKVEKVIFSSSDKAVNPTNVMGTSKLMGERLMTAANSNSRNHSPMFICTRFGNVLGSRGSVLPIFRKQIKRGGPVTLTDPDMSRFIMSIREAVSLVINSAAIACGGEVFVTKMPVIRIKELAEAMIEEFGPKYNYDPKDIEIKIIGTKPGEKLYEELMSQEETRRTIELEKYYVVLPAFSSLYKNINYEYENIRSRNVETPYHSGNQSTLSKDELIQFLYKGNILEEDNLFSPDERYWPDSKT